MSTVLYWTIVMQVVCTAETDPKYISCTSKIRSVRACIIWNICLNMQHVLGHSFWVMFLTFTELYYAIPPISASLKQFISTPATTSLLISRSCHIYHPGVISTRRHYNSIYKYTWNFTHVKFAPKMMPARTRSWRGTNNVNTTTAAASPVLRVLVQAALPTFLIPRKSYLRPHPSHLFSLISFTNGWQASFRWYFVF